MKRIRNRCRKGQGARTAEQIQAACDARDAAIAEYIVSHGTEGVSRARIHITFGITEAISKRILKRLAAAKVIEASHDGGKSLRWGAPGTRAAMDAIRAHNAAAKQARKEQAPSNSARALRHRMKRAEARLAQDFEREPVQQIARKWEFLPPPAPMSVFALWVAT